MPAQAPREPRPTSGGGWSLLKHLGTDQQKHVSGVGSGEGYNGTWMMGEAEVEAAGRGAAIIIIPNLVWILVTNKLVHVQALTGALPLPCPPVDCLASKFTSPLGEYLGGGPRGSGDIAASHVVAHGRVGNIPLQRARQYRVGKLHLASPGYRSLGVRVNP